MLSGRAGGQTFSEEWCLSEVGWEDGGGVKAIHRRKGEKKRSNRINWGWGDK